MDKTERAQKESTRQVNSSAERRRPERRVAELEARDTARHQFFATLSHELRNPIHAIHTNAQLIKSRARDVETSRPAEAIERQVSRLTEILDDLLDVVKIAQGEEMHLATVSLQEVVGDAVETARRSMDIHRRELHVDMPDVPLNIKGDSPRLARAVANLISNAIKYSPQQGEIRVRVFEEGGQGVVAVKDGGMGIAAPDLERIFRLFNVGSVQHDTSGGLGLGLHIARELVEMHGGSVEARSDGVGKGSEFFIHLPLTQDQPHAEAVARTPYNDAQALRILVVDDNRDAADSLATLLEMHGHTGLVAYDGAAALEKSEKLRPHVALVDIGMPTMSGLEVAQRISTEDWGRNTVLVAVTGWGAKSDRAKTKEAGFAYHLTKPVDYDTLASLLSSVVRKPQGRG